MANRPKIRSFGHRSVSTTSFEQDHRGVKLRLGPMLGLKRFGTVAITVACIELPRRIHKGQFNLGRLRLKDTSAPALWNAVLAA
jgi:hypothetical protein